MAVATYTSDLTDIFLFESTTGVTAFGGGASGLGASPDYAVEGTNAVDKQVSASEKGFLFAAGAAFTIGADDHFFIWATLAVYGLADTRNNRGIAVCIGDDTSNFVQFHVNGSDTLPLGGSVPYAVRFVNTALTNFRTLTGTPSTSPDNIGVSANVTGSAKFSNLAADAARIGTGYDILNGTGADPEANFAGIAADDESTAEGVLQTAAGGFKLQGKLRIGSASTACEFLDANTNIFIVDTFHSLTDFTELLVEHASSILTLDNINFIALGTNNPGRLEALTSAATLAVTSCGFIDFGATVLGTGSTMTSCRWIGAGSITLNGGTLTDCTISNSTAASAVLNDDLGDMTGCIFESGGTGHAVELNSIGSGTMSWDNTESGYAATDGSTGNETIYVNVGSGALTINVASGASTPTIRTAGATVTVVAGAVTVAVNVTDGATLADIQNARVLLKASDATGPFPFEESITITRSGAVATVAHTAHGMATNDYVVVESANQPEYNGVHQITVTGVNSYTYAVSGTPATPATGTITGTFAALSGLTDVNGDISTSRTYSTDQPVIGWARKSSASPFYAQGNIVGTITSGGGFSANVQLNLDE